MTPEQFRQEWFLKCRVAIGQIRSVNEDKGTVNVTLLDDLKTPEEGLELPLPGFSIHGYESSWIRYMPQTFDLVYIAWSVKNEARIIGTAMIPGEYAEVAEMDENADFPHADFVKLRQGEWDLRSSGGAYIRGTRDGHLVLSAGPEVQMRLSKSATECRSEAGLWVKNSLGSFQRIGDVKRLLLPTDFAETDVSSLDPLATKESWLHLETPPEVAGQSATLLYDEKSGAVRNSSGVPGTLVGQLRHEKTVYALGATATAPTTSYTEQIDALGNKSTTHAATATSIQETAQTAASSESFLSKEIQALTTAVINATAQARVTSSGNVQLDAPAVQLGAAAVSPVPHGDALLIVLNAIAALLTTLANNPVVTAADSGASAAAATALTTLLGVMSVPGPSPTSLISQKVLVE